MEALSRAEHLQGEVDRIAVEETLRGVSGGAVSASALIDRFAGTLFRESRRVKVWCMQKSGLCSSNSIGRRARRLMSLHGRSLALNTEVSLFFLGRVWFGFIFLVGIHR